MGDILNSPSVNRALPAISVLQRIIVEYARIRMQVPCPPLGGAIIDGHLNHDSGGLRRHPRQAVARHHVLARPTQSGSEP
jgi:hypothetical protein